MFRRLTTTLAVTTALAAFSTAQGDPRLTVSARFDPAIAAPGSTVVLRIEGEIADGYHLYGALEPNSDPTSLAFDSLGALTAVGDPNIPPGTRHEPFAGYETFWIEHKAVFTQRFAVPADASGAIDVNGRVNYMACTETFCDPPAAAAFHATLTVGTAATTSGQAPIVQVPVVPVPGAPTSLFGDDDGKVTLQVRFDPAKAKAGQEVDIVVEVEVSDGWHVYGSGGPEQAITFRVEETFGIEQTGEVRTPEGDLHDYGGIQQYWLEGKFELRQRLRVAEDEGEGELTIEGKLEFVVCNETSCLPPDSIDFEIDLEVVGEDAVTEDVQPIADATGDVGGGAKSSAKGASPVGWWALLVAAIAGGLFALAMPCTYPMIPITFSFFTKQANARGGKVLPVALTYGAGIVLMFSAIGAGFAMFDNFGGGLQAFALHPVTNGVIGVFFILFAFALFGLINLEPPRFLQNFAGKAATHGGLLGVFLMGLCLVVTSFTCTAPFVGSMIAWSAAGGAAKVIGGMSIFGLTMAIPFVFLAMLPGRVSVLPRAGEWMNTLKVTLGFVELAAALKFISNVDVGFNQHVQDLWISAPLFLWTWTAIFVITALYLLGAFSRGVRVGRGRVAGAGLFIVLAAYCGWSSTLDRFDPIMSAIAPPTSAEKHVVITDDFDGALARARAEQKLLLLNFTGFN